MSKPEHPDEVEVAHADSLACAGGCGRLLDPPHAVADPDDWWCAECSGPALRARMPDWVTGWATDAGGPPTTLTTMTPEQAAEVRAQLDAFRDTHGRPAPPDQVARIANEVTVRQWLSVLDRYAMPSGEPPAPRCQVCREPSCEREECRLEPCPWCGADAYTGGSPGAWIDCDDRECAASGPICATIPDAAAAWNALARNHREAPGLRERVAELEAEREALLERLARRDDEIRRLEARR